MAKVKQVFEDGVREMFSKNDLDMFSALIEGSITHKLGLIRAKHGDDVVPYLVYIVDVKDKGVELMPIGPLLGTFKHGYESMEQSGTMADIIMADVLVQPDGINEMDFLRDLFKQAQKKPEKHDIN